MFVVFTRTWWTENPDWPNGLEPCQGEKNILRHMIHNESDAIRICQEWNATHDPGRYSKKAEYEQV